MLFDEGEYIVEGWRFGVKEISRHKTLDAAVSHCVWGVDYNTFYSEKVVCPDGREMKRYPCSDEEGELDLLMDEARERGAPWD